MNSLVAGHDACVVMPTGGGKSLCYQLPAAMLAEQTAIVISPLIALMQDQVAQLTQMGISAAFANSSMTDAERSSVMNEAQMCIRDRFATPGRADICPGFCRRVRHR